METTEERRLRKLKWLCKEHGGHIAIATAADINADALDQVLKGVLLPPKKDGSRSRRSLGKNTARKIEEAFGLEVGWFDADDGFADFEAMPYTPSTHDGLLLLKGVLAKMTDVTRPAALAALHRFIDGAADARSTASLLELLAKGASFESHEIHPTTTRR